MSSFASDALKNLQKVTGGMGTMGTASALAGAAIVAGLIVGIKALYDLGKSFDDAYDRLRGLTGAAGKELKGLEDSFRAVYQRVPEGMGTVVDALAATRNNLQLTGRPLENMTTQFVNLSALDPTFNLKEGIRATADVMHGFGIDAKDMGGQLDDLYTISTSVGIPISELINSLVSGGPAFRAFGFSLQDSAMFLANMKLGGIDTSKALAGLNKAVSSLTTPTPGLTDIEKILGAGKEFDQADLPGRFKLVTDQMKYLAAAGDTNTARLLGLQVFGKRAGNALVDAFLKSTGQSDKLHNSLNHNNDAINRTRDAQKDFGERASEEWHKIQVALEPVASAVFDFANVMAEKLFPILDSVFSFLADHQDILKVLGIIIGTILVVAIAALALALGWMLLPLVAVTVALGLLWEYWGTIWGAISSFFVDTVWHGAIEPALNAIVGFFTDTLPGAFFAFWDGVQAVFGAVADFFTNLPGAIAGWLGDAGSWLWQKGVDLLQGLVNGYTAVWGGIWDFFSGLPGSLLGALGDVGSTLWDAGSNLIGGLLGGVKAGWNAFADFWNGIEVDLPKIHIPGTDTDIGGGTLGLPDLPHFAKGGVVPGAPGQGVPIMAHAGELVVPADQTSAMLGGVPDPGLIDASAKDALAAQQKYVDDSSALLLDSTDQQLAQQLDWQAQSVQGLTDTTAVLGETWTAGLSSMVQASTDYLTMLNVGTQSQYDVLAFATGTTMGSVVSTMQSGAASAADTFVGELGARIPPLQGTLAGYSESVKGYGRDFLTSIGAPVGFARGGIDQSQIAPDGAWRVWAERGTGGEAYIPRHGANDPLGVLSTAASWYGYSVVPFAAGGFTLDELFWEGGSGTDWKNGVNIGRTIGGHTDHTHAGVDAGHVWQDVQAFLVSAGINARPTSTTRPGDGGSLHALGRAADYGDSVNNPQQIYDALLPAVAGALAAMVTRAVVPGPPDFGPGIPALQGRTMADVMQMAMQKFLDAKVDEMLASTAGGPLAGGDYQTYAGSRLGAFGWGGDQLGALIQLWNKESGWNPNARNPSSGAWGIAQFLGADKGPVTSNPYEQIDRGLAYIAQRYGSPAAAWQFWQAHGWYKHGGVLPFSVADSGRLDLAPGMNAVYNGLGRTESLSDGGAGVTVQLDVTIEGNLYGDGEAERAFERMYERAASKLERALNRKLGGGQ